MVKGYADLADLPEDDRITIIGEYLVSGKSDGRPVLVAVEDSAKADRYVLKLNRQFPSIVHWRFLDGLVAGTVSIQIFPPRVTGQKQRESGPDVDRNPE